MFDFTWPCGETLHASEDHVGLHVRCHRCGCIVKITDPRKFVARATPLGDSPPLPRTTPQDLPRKASAGKAQAALALVVLLVVATAVLAYLQGRNPGQPAQHSVRQQEPEQRTPPPKPEVQNVPNKQPQLRELAACQTSRPSTGQAIRSGVYNHGLGELSVENHTELDAVVTLVDVDASGRSARSVYIQSGDETTLRKVAEGSYVLKLSLGLNWCPDTKRFLERKSYSRFANPLDFTVRRLPDTKEYTTHHVTLHPVVGGTARTTQIGEAEFLQAFMSAPDAASEGTPAKK